MSAGTLGTQHAYEQLADVSVNVCTCGKWPTHHVHIGESPRSCGCDSCRHPVTPTP